MFVIEPHLQSYAWGSDSAIQEILGTREPARIAEAWFGAHPLAPSTRRGDPPVGLDELIADEPERMLGGAVHSRYGARLPYLLKLIAADRPLSMQVHPNTERAREGFAQEEVAGVPRTSPTRNYRDANHKPELVLALTPFEAVSGFRTPRRAAEMFEGLGTPLADGLSEVLRGDPTPAGVRTVFARLVTPGLQPEAHEVAELAEACARRLRRGSPSVRVDRTVGLLQEEYPGDPGVVASLLLNPVTLQPGEAMFVPAGAVHAYLHGVGVEVMASSDNVLRAGLTHKHVDVGEVLRNVDYVAAPPIRIGPEVSHGSTRVFYAPVDDFALSVTEVADPRPRALPGGGPRVLLCLDGQVEVGCGEHSLALVRGDAAFLSAVDGAARICGDGTVVQATVP